MVEVEQVVFSSSRAGLEVVLRSGRRLGHALRPGDIVLLRGPLGAGKTTFVRAVAEALDVTDSVRSPSFTIANIYSGRWTIQHLDLYRLEGVADEDALALEEYARPDAVTLVEWPEAAAGLLGPPAWRVGMDHVSPRTRSLEIRACSEEARHRWEEVGDLG